MGFPGAAWTPSPNYYAGRGAALTHVVLHTTEQTDSRGLEILTDPFRTEYSGRVSAHYLVLSTGQVLQLVRDHDEAWHARDANPYSIGIEVSGSAGNPATWSEPVVASLASLVGWLSAEYGIPLEYREEPSAPPLARGFVAHSALHPEDRADPGQFFPWDEIRARAAGSAPAGSEAGWFGFVAVAAALAALAWSLSR